MKAISNPDSIFIVSRKALQQNADTTCMVYQIPEQNREMTQTPNC
jgi:hypothetical protein